MAMKLDMHFHSKESDWENTWQEMIEWAKQRNLEAIFLTDHDEVTNDDFIKEAKYNWILTWKSVEISACNYSLDWKSLHLTAYSNNFSNRVYELLDESKNWHIQMVRTLVNHLSKNWFELTSEELFTYFENKWKNINNVNKFNVAEYIYSKSINREFIKSIAWKDLDLVTFYKSFLKSEWEFSKDFVVKTSDYELSVEVCWKVVSDVDWILSIAHPWYTFEKEWLDHFKSILEDYIDKWVNALEINAYATKEWINFILEAKEKYWLYITFWSDCHKLWEETNKHFDLWTINPLLDKKFIKQCFEEYREKIVS